MNTQRISVLIPPYGTATLTLPELMTSEAFARLDAAIDQALGAPNTGPAEAAKDPGAIEYESWRLSRY